MSDLVRRSDVLDILGNVFATTLNVDVDVAIAAMMCKIKYMPKVDPDDTTEAYEKEQEQKIVAGDIVTTINGECEYLVTNVQLPNTLHTVNTRNGYLQTMKISCAKKTGKHIDIQSILQPIGGGSDD